MTDFAHDRLVVLIIVIFLGLMCLTVTGAIVVMALTTADPTVQHEAMGGLIGSAAFGGGSLLMILGVRSMGARGTQVIAQPPSSITVNDAPAPAPGVPDPAGDNADLLPAERG